MASSYPERRSPSGRFLPPDPRTSEPYRFTPQLALRVGVLAGLALIIFAILFLRLWALQVLSGDRYVNAAQNNQLRTIRVEAQRGSIVDRNGRTIVSNVPGTAVRIWTADLPDEGRYAMFKRLSKILRVPLPRLTRALEENKGDPLTPILVKTAVHEDQVAMLLEHRADFPGVEVTSTYLRDYEHKALAAQLLGYVGEVSPEELKRLEKSKDSDIRGGEKIGKTGVEAAYDRWLRGTPGMDQLRVDSLGQPLGRFEPRRPSQSGYNVRLTLDVGLQQAAERALRDGIELARQDDKFNANGGAIVALDPRDGAVLAMASNPTYKPSVYVGRADPKKLEPLVVEKVAKQWNYPGINRAIAGVYPPGSTFKPLTALAAISDGLLSPYEYIQCTPSAKFGLDEFEFRNWNPYTNMAMTLSTALSQSCDTYFYDVGNRYFERGERERPYWTKMQSWAKKFGFGQQAGLDISGEATGLLPTPAWRKSRRPDRLGQGLEPGRHDPDGDRPEGHQRDAAADGALLRGARQRRQARHAAPRPGRRAAGGGGRAGGAGADLPGGAAEGDRGRPDRARGRARRPLRGDARRERHLVRRLRQLPGPGRGQDGHGGEGRQPPRLPRRPPRGPGLVVRLGSLRRQRLRQLARREADADRRLRRDRERRPRRLGGGTGGAGGLRALVPRARRRPGGGRQ